MKLLAFDTELAHNERLAGLTEGQQIWDAWPLGISVAATYALPAQQTNIWYSWDYRDAMPAKEQTLRDTEYMLDFLLEQQEDNVPVVTWNGAGYDFQLLARLLPRRLSEVRGLTLKSYDPFFQSVCAIGYGPGQNAVAKGLGLPLKTIEGKNAPMLWEEGFYQEVVEYVANDAKTLALIAQYIDEKKGIRWITKSGDLHFEFMPRLLTVEQSLNLALPNTGRMEKPRTREEYIEWFIQR